MNCVIQLAGKIDISMLFSLCFELRNKSIDIVGSSNHQESIIQSLGHVERVHYERSGSRHTLDTCFYIRSNAGCRTSNPG